jgi:hypothetical protein
VTVDPANLVTPATAPIGREIDRRVDPIVAAVLACPQVASQIRRAVAPLACGLRVDVSIEDLAVGGDVGPQSDITDRSCP